MTRTIPITPVLVAAALALAISIPVSVAQQNARQESPADTHAGQFVSATETEMTMTADNKQHSHKITAETRVTLNGAVSDIKSLRKGDAIQVTMGADNVALKINATRQQQRPQDQPAAQRPTDRPASPSATNSTQPGQNRTNPPARETQPQPGQARSTEPAQPGAAPARQERFNGAARGNADRRNAERENDSAFLGVALAPSRGGGVFVPDVADNGPAERAGLRSGDYILSINGQRISSPDDFQDVLAEMNPGDEAKIIAWRDGRQHELTAQLVSQREAGFRPDFDDENAEFDNRPAQDFNQSRAWLGVMLVAAEGEQGVKIDRVHDGSPAAEAGMKRGDILVRVNGDEATDIQATSQKIGELEAGAQIELVIRRNNEEQTLTATLAERSQFAGSQSNSFQPDYSDFGDDDIPEHLMMLEQHRHLARQNERLEQLCYKVLQEVQELRKEVNAMKPGNGTVRPVQSQPAQP